MKNLLHFIQKEFLHIWRDKRSLMILIGMPIAQVVLFGFAITNEIKNAHIGIYAPENDLLSQKISNKILAADYFILDEYLNSEKEIHDLFKKGKTKMVVYFEPDFSKNYYKDKSANIRLITDATDPNTANLLVGYATAIIKDFQLSENNISSMPYQINIVPNMKYNPEMKSVFMFVPGIITIILMLVSAMMTSIAITREKELGTMEVMLVSPMRPGTMIIAKVIPYLFISLLNAFSVLALGFWIFHVPLVGSFGMLFLMTLLFALTTLSLGILISTVSNTMQTAMMISLMALMMPTILLSGFIFPVENMPIPLQVISNIIPAKWFIIIIKGVMLKGVGLSIIWKETLVLVGMTLFFIAVSIKKFKIRLA
jgi:ABC-2 type transport system permease protein